MSLQSYMDFPGAQPRYFVSQAVKRTVLHHRYAKGVPLISAFCIMQGGLTILD